MGLFFILEVLYSKLSMIAKAAENKWDSVECVLTTLTVTFRPTLLSLRKQLLQKKFRHNKVMADQLLNKARVDRTAFSVMTLSEAEQSDRDYWKSRIVNPIIS